MSRHTCGGCANLKRHDMMGCPVYSCQATGFIVPQSSTKELATFTRVPLECPLPAAEVVKSEKPAAKRHWVEVKP